MATTQLVCVQRHTQDITENTLSNLFHTVFSMTKLPFPTRKYAHVLI
jgi:hypothetical protein